MQSWQSREIIAGAQQIFLDKTVVSVVESCGVPVAVVPALRVGMLYVVYEFVFACFRRPTSMQFMLYSGLAIDLRSSDGDVLLYRCLHI
jgi:hypothetical protein